MKAHLGVGRRVAAELGQQVCSDVLHRICAVGRRSGASAARRGPDKHSCGLRGRLGWAGSLRTLVPTRAVDGAKLPRVRKRFARGDRSTTETAQIIHRVLSPQINDRSDLVKLGKSGALTESQASSRSDITHARPAATAHERAPPFTVHSPPPCRSRSAATSESTSSAATERSAASSAAFRRWSPDACRHLCRRSLHKCASWGSRSTFKATRRNGGCPARRYATLATRPPALALRTPRQRRRASCRSC